MSITKKDRYDLIRILFQEQSKAILNSQEFKGRASLSRSDLKDINNNYDTIASHAATYFLNKYPNEEDITNENIKESLMVALLACLGNGKK